MFNEFTWEAVAGGLYALAALAAVVTAARKGDDWRPPLFLLTLAIAANTVSILIRWERLDHGPYVNLRETLSSSAWGYHLALLLAVWLIPIIRPIMAIVLPFLLVLVAWMFVVPTYDSGIPVTYDTPWVFIHIMLGKVFIGCVVVAFGLALVTVFRAMVARRAAANTTALAFATMPSDKALQELAFRFMVVGFVFDTLMLIVGAIWAQDAWGRYWDWDPLEVWSFLTWLGGAFYLHLRVVWKPSPVVLSAFIGLVFVLAFLTYFGLPFISTAAHQGVV